MRVLDLGTGSGILALAAVKLNASEVIGLDVDPQAISVAKTNAQLNHHGDRIQFNVSDAGWLKLNGVEPFDLIVSNILAEVHLQSINSGLLDSLRPGGHLILSGMNRPGAEKVAGALEQCGSDLIDQARMGSWWALVAGAIQGK
jgi:ribosomal protein L11 methyltransferase